jgi:hypothetical protein
MTNACLRQISTLNYRIWSRLYMRIESCVVQQLFVVLIWVLMKEFTFRLQITGRVQPKQILIFDSSKIWHQRKIYFLLLWGLVCNYWVLRLHVVCLFFTQRFSSFGQSDKIYIAKRCSVVLLRSAFLPCPLEWRSAVIAQPDWRMFIWGCMKLCKRHAETDYFLCSDFCTSETTKMNPTRHAKNTTDCGKRNFSNW